MRYRQTSTPHKIGNKKKREEESIRTNINESPSCVRHFRRGGSVVERMTGGRSDVVAQW